MNAKFEKMQTSTLQKMLTLATTTEADKADIQEVLDARESGVAARPGSCSRECSCQGSGSEEREGCQSREEGEGEGSEGEDRRRAGPRGEQGQVQCGQDSGQRASSGDVLPHRGDA